MHAFICIENSGSRFYYSFHVLDFYAVFMTLGNHLQWILDLPK
jgi:hypothetical protein